MNINGNTLLEENIDNAGQTEKSEILNRPGRIQNEIQSKHGDLVLDRSLDSPCTVTEEKE